MKKFQNKFSVLYEDVVTRFQSGGLMPGDVVKIRKDALNNPRIKGMTETYKAQLKNAIETDLNLRVSAIKSIRPNTSQNYSGYGTDAAADFHIDIVTEYAPGLWRNPITVPMEILELNDTGINMAPVPDSLKRKSEETKGAEAVTNDEWRTNPKKNVKISTTSPVSDGRDQIDKPIKRESKENDELALETLYRGICKQPTPKKEQPKSTEKLISENIESGDLRRNQISQFCDDMIKDHLDKFHKVLSKDEYYNIQEHLFDIVEAVWPEAGHWNDLVTAMVEMEIISPEIALKIRDESARF